MILQTCSVSNYSIEVNKAIWIGNRFSIELLFSLYICLPSLYIVSSGSNIAVHRPSSFPESDLEKTIFLYDPLRKRRRSSFTLEFFSCVQVVSYNSLQQIFSRLDFICKNWIQLDKIKFQILEKIYSSNFTTWKSKRSIKIQVISLVFWI